MMVRSNFKDVWLLRLGCVAHGDFRWSRGSSSLPARDHGHL